MKLSLRLAVGILLSSQLLLAQPAQKKSLTVDDLFRSRKFSGESLRGVHWTRDGRAFYYTEFDRETRSTDFMRYDLASGKRSLVLAGQNIQASNGKQPFRFQHHIWSPDERALLFTGTHRARGIKTGGNFHLFDLQTKRLKTLTDTQAFQVNVKFSPDGRAIAFVRDNNLMLLDLETGQEKQLTHDGRKHVLNGHFDWVYEEEFGIIDGWHWSPDGKRIAYWQLDENRVPGFSITHYDSLHLSFNHMRYPKAGDPNSIVRIGVVDIANADQVWMDLGENDDLYVPRIQWLPDGRLAMLRLNRLQNHVELLIGDPQTGATHTAMEEKSEQWLDIEDGDLIFLKNKPQFLWSSDRDGFKHLYLYDLNGTLLRQLTKGQWEVRSVVGVDEKRGHVYFMAAEKSPLENHLYRIGLNGKGFTRLTQTAGWHRVEFSPNFEYYLDYYSDARTPTKVALFTRNGKRKNTVVANAIPALADYAMSYPEFTTITTSDGVTLNAWMLKPPDFDPNKRYPLLMYVYGGPGSQTVRNGWGGRRFLWHALLAQKGYIVASVDNRGTGARGAAFKKITYKNLGHWEVNDQIEAARFFGRLPYVDETRIGIWGWSYGGYMAAFCLFRGNEVFKMAIAGAPVTSWRFYDTIYTERYMQTPQLNPKGYDASAPLNYAKDLKGDLLVIHGTADDNVHFQNSVRLVEELIKHGKQFRTMYYPGEYHGIHRGAHHLYTLMTNFILEKL